MLIIPSSELRVWAAQSGSQSATQPKYSSQTQFTTIFCWELEVFKKDTRGPLRFHCLSGSASPWPWILTAFFPSAVMLMSLCAVISVGLWLVNCARPEADWHQTQSLRAQALDAVTKRVRGPRYEEGLLSRVRTLFHYILGGQNIMQNYSAIFLSWFVPVRADNEEILISVQAPLSFVTEQIVDWWP